MHYSSPFPRTPQLPRLYNIYRQQGTIEHFGQMIDNIFVPLFEATRDPASHPHLHMFLKTVVGFDMVGVYTPSFAWFSGLFFTFFLATKRKRKRKQEYTQSRGCLLILHFLTALPLINYYQISSPSTKNYPLLPPKNNNKLKNKKNKNQVDDESKPERRPTRNARSPAEWTSANSPPYSYWCYYVYANLFVLNKFRWGDGGRR